MRSKEKLAIYFVDGNGDSHLVGEAGYDQKDAEKMLAILNESVVEPNLGYYLDYLAKDVDDPPK